MRVPTDLPRRPRRSPRVRPALIFTAGVVLVVVLSLGKIAGFYTDYLWFQQLGFTQVFTGLLGAKIFLAVLFALLMFLLVFVNLLVADRVAPKFALLGPDDELVQRYREVVGIHAGKVRLGTALLFALVLGTGQSRQWNAWILFRNSTSFGIKDPQFSRDIGFYVFRLPFLQSVVSWSFAAVVVATFLTAVYYYLNGGIRLQVPTNRVTPQVKAHLSVLFGLMALIKAVGYYLNSYGLVLSTKGYVQGAGYTDVHARLPALRLLMVIMVGAFLLFIYNIRLRGWTLPLLAIGLWMLVAVVVNGIYPLVVQQVTVNPQQNRKEQLYIQRNINSTRVSLGIDKVKVTDFPYNSTPNALSAPDLTNNARTIRNIRLWDPGTAADPITLQTYQQEKLKQFYQIQSINFDRYQLGGSQTQTIMSMRELNQADLPGSSWVNRHLIFTHGYGAVLAPANAVTGNGAPVFSIRDVPPAVAANAPSGTPVISQPGVYFGRAASSFSIVDTKQPELDYQRKDGTNVSSQYQGSGGVELSSFLRKLSFASRFKDPTILISGQITPHSRIMYVRNVAARVKKVAPFLALDADPYAVILPDGRLIWIQDAYTTTDKYPYGQQANVNRLPGSSGLKTNFNYVRNSVKVVVDAYDGATTLYVQDPSDPIIRTYEKAFPKMFRPAADMPDGMAAHLRYPQDLFEAQTTMYGRYHILDPQAFFASNDAWNVATDPGTGRVDLKQTATAQVNASGVVIANAQLPRQAPYYLVTRLPNETKEEFEIIQPFVPQSSGDNVQNLTAFMVAKSGDVAGDYGQLLVFKMPAGVLVHGPSQIDTLIKQDPTVSKDVSLLNSNGSEADFGNVLGIPIGNAVLYVRSLYVKSTTSTNNIPQFKKAIVVYGDRVAYEDSLQKALADLFPGIPNLTQEEAPATPPGGTTPPSPRTPPTTAPPGAVQTVQQLLQQADADFADAGRALAAGDLGNYQTKNKAGADLVTKALAQLGVVPPSATTTVPGSPPTTTPAPSGA